MMKHLAGSHHHHHSKLSIATLQAFAAVRHASETEMSHHPKQKHPDGRRRSVMESMMETMMDDDGALSPPGGARLGRARVGGSLVAKSKAGAKVPSRCFR